MKLRALRIRELPGIAEPFGLEDLGDGLHVISGPNASGKSSLLRALRYLLGGVHAGDSRHLRLEAELVAGQVHWRVERSGSRLQWWRNGEQTDAPPPLPPRETLESYLLGVDTLLIDTHGDQAIARHFQRELAGGYDLPALRDRLKISTRSDGNAGRALEECARELHKAERHNRELVDRQRRLPQLEERIREAAQIVRGAGQHEKALRLLELLAEHRRVLAERQAFPLMPSEEDARRIQELEQRLQRLQQQRDEETTQRDQARRWLEQAGLDEPAKVDTATADKWLRALQQLEQEVARIQQQFDAARGRVREAAEAVGAREPDGLFRPDEKHVGEIERCAAAVRAAQQQLDVARARVPASDEAPVSPEGRKDLVGAGISLVGGALLLFLAWPHSAGLAALAAALVAVGAAVSARRLLVPAPSKSDHSDAIMVRDAERELDDARKALARAATAAGMTTENQTASSMELLVNRLHQLDQARREQRAQQEQYQQAQQRRQAQCGRLRELLHRWDTEAAGDDSQALEASLDTLKTRRDQALHAQRIREEKDRRLESLHGEIEDVGGQLDKLYRKLELEPGDNRTLQQRLEQLPRWNEVEKKHRELETQIRIQRDELQHADEQLRAWIEADNREAIEQARTRAEEEESTLETLREERERIRAEIAQAERSHALEQHRAAFDAAHEDLQLRFEQRMIHEAANFLLDEVEQEHRSAHQPETLRRADERLRTFTRGQFAIRLDEYGAIRARDQRQEVERNLDALSVGTRMQLLIALRLAWAEQSEQHTESLPFFLDEALTTTDPERFDAVASALADEAAERGRQIFYLTAQAEDLERWRRATGTTPGHTDLARERSSSTAGPQPLTLPERQPLPSPDGLTAEQWATKAKIPAITPHNDAGAIALFHLLRDELSLLHRLMEGLRVTTVGELEGILETSVGRNHLDPTARHRLRQRITIARTWLEAWREGRGHPVDRGALEETDAVTDTQLDRVDAVAAEQDRDAIRLVGALRNKAVRGFRTAKIDELEDWLQEQGYLDPREPLTEDERYRRVLGAVHHDAESMKTVKEVVHWLEVAVRPPGDSV